MNAPSTTSPGKSPEGAARRPLRVLLVEDNPDDAALVVRVLRRGGYELDWQQVQTANALEVALAGKPWDIVLSDYAMPQFDALRALQTVRAHSAFLPFIIISGSIGEEIAVAAMRAGASDYVMKTNLTRLLPAIERELREAAARRERARTKKALLEAQAKFKVIFHEYLDVMLVLGLDGQILHVNHAIARTMGYDEERLPGQPFGVLWPERQRSLADAILEGVQQDGSAFYSGPFRRLDGSVCPMDLQASKVPWGRTDAVIVTLRDVTERYHAQQRLAEEKEQLAVTLRSMADGVVTTDTVGRVSLVNGAAERLTGWTQDEAVGQPLEAVLSLFCGDNDAPSDTRVREVLRKGETVEIGRSIKMRARDGRDYAIALKAAPIHLHDGENGGMVIVFRDTTAEQKLEDELQKASKLESVALLAGGIAHDFNNILTAILGHLSLAKTSLVPSPQVIHTIEKACLYATDLTRQLLTFSKENQPVRRVEDIPGVVREGVEFALHGSSLRCRFDLPPGLHRVEVDRGQIHQVINNLVINAVQATAGRGVLDVAMRNVVIGADAPVADLPPGAYVRLSIHDDGPGIAPASLARIFDPYFTTKQEGNGLGLATAYSIIRKHRGLLQAESEPGRGASFHIYLPAAAAPAPAPRARASAAAVPAAAAGQERAPAASAPPAGSGRILFMDDETILQELVAAMLEYLGYGVVCAPDGGEALARYEEARSAGQPFDVVLMDLTVPGGMGGQEAMQRLRVLDPDVKAIVSSGYSNDPIMADFRRHGFSGVIAKPYQMAELSRVLQEVLKGDVNG